MHSKISSRVKKGCRVKFGSVIEAGSMGPLPLRAWSSFKKGVMKSATTPSMSSPRVTAATI